MENFILSFCFAEHIFDQSIPKKQRKICFSNCCVFFLENSDAKDVFIFAEAALSRAEEVHLFALQCIAKAIRS